MKKLFCAVVSLLLIFYSNDFLSTAHQEVIYAESIPLGNNSIPKYPYTEREVNYQNDTDTADKDTLKIRIPATCNRENLSKNGYDENIKIFIGGPDQVQIPKSGNKTVQYFALVISYIGNPGKIVTNSNGDINGQTVAWAVYDSTYHPVDSLDIDVNGRMTIGSSTIPGEYIIKAAWIPDNSVYSTMSVWLMSNESSNSVFILGPKKVWIPVTGNKSVQYHSITTVSPDEDPFGEIITQTKTVAWAVYDSTYHEIESLNIDSTGMLTVNSKAIPGDYLIKAVLYPDGTATDIKHLSLITYDPLKLSIDKVAWMKNDALSSDTLFSTAYGNGMWIAVGGDGCIKSSVDGKGWITRVSGVNDSLNSVLWNSKEFLAVGENGTILVSKDGIDWYKVDSKTTRNLNNVIWVENRFLAVGDGGTVCVSNDGIDWTVMNAGTADTLTSVTWNGKKYIAVCSNDGILASEDGTHWNHFMGSYPLLTSVTSGNGIFVAVSLKGKIFYSPDGNTWSETGNVGGSLRCAKWVKNQFLALDINGYLYTSPDGISWTKEELQGEIWGCNNIFWSNDQYIIVGMNGTIFSSIDMKQWSAYKIGVGSPLNGAVWDGTKFTAVGENKILTSRDGKTWTTTALEGALLNSITWNGQLYVAVGWNGGIYTSSDEIIWSKVSLDPIKIDRVHFYSKLNKVLWNGSKFIAIGNDGTILESKDGLDWNLDESGTSKEINDILWNGHEYVAVCGGFQDTAGGEILVSPDGSYWLKVYSDSNSRLLGIAWNDERYIVVGRGLRGYLTATDDFSWTLQVSNQMYLCQNVRWDGNEFVVLNYDRGMIHSHDGVNWETTKSITSNILNSIVWNENNFVAVGSGGTILFGGTPATNIALNIASASVERGNSNQLAATVFPSTAINKNITWTSNNNSVARVSAIGLVTAVAKGTAVISASIQGNQDIHAECAVTVTETSPPGGTTPGGGGGVFTMSDQPDQKVVEDATKAVKEIEETAPKSNYPRELNNKILQTINDALAKIAVKTITPSLNGDNEVNALIDYRNKDDIIDIAGTVSQTVEAIKNRIDNISVKAKLEKKVSIEIPADTKINTVTTEVPSNLFIKVAEKGIDKVEIVSPLASITVSPDFINMDSRAITFGVTSTSENNQLVVDLKLNVTDKPGTTSPVNMFDKNITVSIPYTLKDGEDKDSITVMYIAPDGSKTNMSGKYVNGYVVFRTRHFGKYVITNQNVSFSDISTHWSKKYVLAMESKGLIGGKGKELFDPNGRITLAEFVTMVMNLIGGVDENAVTKIKDIHKTDWYYKYVASAVKAGIIEETVKFSPNTAVSREDMAIILSKVLKNTYKESVPADIDSVLKRFTDQREISEAARSAIATCIQYQVMGGKGAKFDAKGTSTRAEAATILYNLFYF